MIDFDFLPPEFHRARVDQRVVRRNSALILLMVGTMGAWMYANASATRTADASLADVLAQRAQIRVHRATVEAMREQRAELAAREELRNWLDDRASAVVVLAELSRASAPAIVLTEVLLSSGGPAGHSSLPHTASGRCLCDACWRARTASAVTAAPGLPDNPAASRGQPDVVDAGATATSRLPYLRLTGLASEAAKAGDLAAGLTGSPYFTDVTTRVLGMGKWADRQVTRFEITCRLLPHTGGRK